jgi:hypothetical protein
MRKKLLKGCRFYFESYQETPVIEWMVLVSKIGSRIFSPVYTCGFLVKILEPNFSAE